MANPQASVIVPVGSHAGYLEEALDSLAGQRAGDFEVLVIDDRCDALTRGILQEWTRRDRRFRLVTNNRAPGLVGALGTGVEQARAELIVRFDADDVAHPERLEQQVAFMHSHPGIALVATRFHLLSKDPPGGGYRRYRDWQNALLQPADIHRARFIEAPVAHPTVCLRAEVLRHHGGYRDCGWPEDYDLWLRFLEAGQRMAKLPHDLHGWRDHPARLSRHHPRYSREAFWRLKAHFLRRGPLRTARPVCIWGAGPTGSRLWRALRAEGAHIRAFIDIDPRKIGSVRGGLPIVGPEDSLLREQPFILAAVGGDGAAVLERDLRRLGLRAGRDYLRVA